MNTYTVGVLSSKCKSDRIGMLCCFLSGKTWSCLLKEDLTLNECEFVPAGVFMARGTALSPQKSSPQNRVATKGVLHAAVGRWVFCGMQPQLELCST